MTEYYEGDLEKDLLAINDDQFYKPLQSIGESIGYGRAQQILQILWAKSLDEKGISTQGALIPKPPKKYEDLEAEFNIALGLLWRLIDHGYIQTFNDELENQCDHLKNMAVDLLKKHKPGLLDKKHKSLG